MSDNLNNVPDNFVNTMSAGNTSSNELGSLEDSFKKMELEDNLAFLMRDCKYKEALEILEQLRPIQTDPGRKIHTLVLMTSCYLLLENHRSAVHAQRDLAETVRSSGSTAEFIKNKAKELVKDKSFVKAFLMFYAAAKLYKDMAVPDETVKGIKACVYEVRMFVEAMVKNDVTKKIVTGHVIPSLKEMTNDISKVEDASEEIRIENQVWCLYNIGWCFEYCGDNESKIQVLESAISLMETELKDEANKYQVLGYCYNNLGVEYKDIGQKKEAMEKYEKAISVYHNAKDFATENERRNKISRTENNLRLVKE